MRTKAGAILEGLQPEMKEALSVLDETRQEALATCASIPDAVVTAGLDGQHMEGSLHYQGLAIDIRLKDYAEAWMKFLENRLGRGWDIVVEGDHIHIERDPKKKPLDPT